MTSRDPIADRLRAALAPGELPLEGVDMRPAAITERLREACELSELCLALGAAGEAFRPRGA